MTACEQKTQALFQFRVKRACIVALALALVSCGGGDSFDTSSLVGAENERDTPSLGSAIGSEANATPSIEGISLGCDLVLDSIAIADGVVTNFTLVVEDESPLTLRYSIDSDNEAIAVASVDTNGVFSLNGLQAGSTTMPVTVTDDRGASDQVLLAIVVRSE